MPADVRVLDAADLTAGGSFMAFGHVLSAGAAALVAVVATDGRHEQRHSGATPRLVTGS
jgi:hypothetical protein